MRSPAEVLQNALIAGGQGCWPSVAPVGVWPIFVSHMPSDPDNAVSIYDTSGYRNGRIMATGENIDHPGWQIRVRGRDYRTGYDKIRALELYAATILGYAVALDSVAYTIHAVTRTGTIFSLGQEQDARRRCEFTVNGTMTLTAILGD